MVTKNCTVVIKLTVENNGDFYFKIKCKCYNFYCNNVKKSFFFHLNVFIIKMTFFFTVIQ